jgi:hypothetical protein
VPDVHDIYSDIYGETPDSSGMTGGAFEGDIQVLVRNPDRSYGQELEYTTLELVPRYCAVGSWSLEASYDGDLASPVGQLLQPGAGIVAVCNGRVIMSGPVTKPARIRDGDLNRVSIGGVDDMQLLVDRVAHQAPSTADTLSGGNTYAAAMDVRTGHAETVIRQYVNVNLGPSSIAARRIAGLTLAADLARGTTVTGQARQQALLELLQELAKAGGVGFRITQTGPSALFFEVTVPADKSSSVVFSVGLGNLQGYEYSSERPAANVTYAGGTGEGAARIFRIGQDSSSVSDWGRIESFLEDSSSDTAAKLDQSLAAELVSTAAQFHVTATAIDTHTHQWAPLVISPLVETYDLGDTVSVLVDGQIVTEVIRELHVVQNADGRTVTPVVGSAEQSGRPEQRFFEAVISEMRRLRARVRELERR